VTRSPYAAFTRTCRSTYTHRYPTCGGNHTEASDAPLSWFAPPSTASRLAGSFANARLRAAVQADAPDRHASASATTWSICTSAESGPRAKAIIAPV
jgi:hypothetical protein